VSIVEVQIRSSNPPPEVVAAFRDVNNAQQDADSAVNEANTYRNRVINEAKGDAAKVVQAAEGYREQSVRDALGEASRFNQIISEYHRAPAVTRERLYLETMERVLAHSNKVVVSGKGTNAPIILPSDIFRPRTAAAPVPAPPPTDQSDQSAQPQVQAQPGKANP
jgi:membrane protease subunit HflK